MERLTARNKRFPKEAYYPYCFRNDTCDGQGPSDKCDMCPLPYHICETLADYEDTGLTPERIRELKERNTAKAPKICKNKHSDAYTCPNCALVLINKDEKGWFCGKHYKFCPDCGQRLKWEE